MVAWGGAARGHAASRDRMAQDVPPQLREQLSQFQNLQQQMQLLAQQKAQFELQSKELQKAGEALADADDQTPIYRSVGAFLIQTQGKGAVLKEIDDDAETLGVRIKNLERQESRLKESLTELQSKIQAGLARLQGQGKGGE